MAELSELERIRTEKMKLMQTRNLIPFPHRARRTHFSSEAIAAFETASGEVEVQVIVAGRLRAIRHMGKVSFVHIEDGKGRLQLFFRANDIGIENIKLLKDYFDLGDFIEATGKMFRTRTGEITVHVAEFRMLAKAITPLPASKEELVDGERVVHAAFDNPEARYRQRYADLAVNPAVRDIFRIRARMIQALRTYLDERDFIEVETPVLQPIYGGAAAKPFVTHHNQLHQDLYLRISFELYLKRLLVGGLERVYEIGRDFRNEGVSFKHNPEFTQLEFYMAYADYNVLMDMTEQMVAYAAEQATGSPRVIFQGAEINFAPPWKRITVHAAIKAEAGIDIGEHSTAAALRQAMLDKGLEPSPKSTWGKLVDSLIGNFVEPNCIQPTLLYDYPRDISPLAKSKPEDDRIVERFEGFVGGMELCNAFTELNDPVDQERRFLEMGRDYAADDDEHHPMDEDYIRAMRYGMPPNGGFGMGIDRLAMLFCDKATIREVILFPHLRSRARDAYE